MRESLVIDRNDTRPGNDDQIEATQMPVRIQAIVLMTIFLIMIVFFMYLVRLAARAERSYQLYLQSQDAERNRNRPTRTTEMVKEVLLVKS